MRPCIQVCQREAGRNKYSQHKSGASQPELIWAKQVLLRSWIETITWHAERIRNSARLIRSKYLPAAGGDMAASDGANRQFHPQILRLRLGFPKLVMPSQMNHSHRALVFVEHAYVLLAFGNLSHRD